MGFVWRSSATRDTMRAVDGDAFRMAPLQLEVGPIPILSGLGSFWTYVKLDSTECYTPSTPFFNTLQVVTGLGT